MLERIQVDGFRSLRDFKLDLAPGLNILVGSNGAGKTNIISFFEFMSQLCDHDVADSIHRIGGVASVLHRDVELSYSEISFVISGTSRVSSVTSGDTRIVVYEYGATIVVSEELTDIFFSKQRLKLNNKRADTTDQYFLDIFDDPTRTKWDLEVSSDSDVEHSRFSFDRVDLRKLSVLASSRMLFDKKSNTLSYIAKNIREEHVARVSLLSILEMYLPNLRAIKSDLRSGEVYNIYPGSVKAREDISTPVGVQPDGSGTAATLLALSRLSARARSVAGSSGSVSSIVQRSRYRLVPNAFLDIKKLMSLVNPGISDISITLEAIDGYIRVTFHIDAAEGSIQVPLQRMSDGTVKWLALVTAIRTNRSMFAIEEPENYLHPYMQREVISIIRNAFSSGRSRAFALISTHSETLLNAVRPEEVIVVSMANGRTKAERPKDPDAINEIISDTGFGLGTIFVGGGLDDA